MQKNETTPTIHDAGLMNRSGCMTRQVKFLSQMFYHLCVCFNQGVGMFSINIGDRHSEIEGTLSKFAVDTKLDGAADASEGRDSERP